MRGQDLYEKFRLRAAQEGVNLDRMGKPMSFWPELPEQERQKWDLLCAELFPQAPPAQRGVVQDLHTGALHVVMGNAVVYTDVPLRNMDRVALYADGDGAWYCRRAQEVGTRFRPATSAQARAFWPRWLRNVLQTLGVAT